MSLSFKSDIGHLLMPQFAILVEEGRRFIFFNALRFTLAGHPHIPSLVSRSLGKNIAAMRGGACHVKTAAMVMTRNGRLGQGSRKSYHEESRYSPPGNNEAPEFADSGSHPLCRRMRQ